MDASLRASRDALIADRLYALPEYRDASVVFAYNSFGAEVDTHAIITHALGQGKTVALPHCVPHMRMMHWYRIGALEGLERGAFGVLEPPEDSDRLLDLAHIDGATALVPALAFDDYGYRLGYGGGFYDAFLAAFSGIAIGLCRSCQRVDDLTHYGACEPHDERVSIVVTDEGVLRAS